MKGKHTYWMVEACAHGYRSELWSHPYTGQFIACTRIVGTRKAAAADGRRIFSSFQRHPSQSKAVTHG